MGDNLAIVCIFGVAFGSMAVLCITNMISKFMDQKIKMLEIQSEKQEGSVAGLSEQVKLLQQEMAHLRETSTKYDLSLDNTLHETQHRLARLEVKTTGEPIRTFLNTDQPQPIEQRSA